MEVILQVFYSVFSGVMLAAAIPNEIYYFGAPYFTLIALIPFYLTFYRVKNYAQAFRAGFIQAITTHLISSYWLAYFKDFAVFTLGASALGTGVIGGFFGFVYYLPYSSSTAHNRLNEESALEKFYITPFFRIFYFSALYTVYEWVKSSGFLGYPWGTVSSAMFRWPILMQVSSITGTYGITFFIVFINSLLSEALLFYISMLPQAQKTSAKKYYLKNIHTLFLILTGAVLSYGLIQFYLPRKPIKQLSTILIQQNSDPWKQKSDDDNILLSENLTEEKLKELKQDKIKPNLVVWSEGVLSHSLPNGEKHYSRYPSERPLLKFIREKDVPFLIGGSFLKNSEKKQINNAALVFDRDGNFRGCYAKNHLVPFAEVIPFSDIPAVSNFLKKIVGISAGWTPGDQYTFFEIPCTPTKYYKLPAVRNIDITQSYSDQQKDEQKPTTVKIATPICFDDAFTDIMRPLFLNGAELFINMTDDSWSLKDSSEIQHFVIASYRAIEYRTTLVRCANAGYSVVVDPSGKVIKDMPLFEAQALAADVPVYKHSMTTYARYGNWMPYTFIIFFICYLAYSILTFTKTDYVPSERKIKKNSKKSKKKNSKNKK